jgi:hypothetical protein
MELLIPLLIFALVVYAMGSGSRSAPGAEAEWPADPGRRRGDPELELLKRTYGRLAQEREGRRLDRAPHEGPRVAYLFRATRAVLSLHVIQRDDGPDDRFTQLSYAVPAGWRHRIEIGPISSDVLAEVTLAGMVRVASGDDAFDRRTRILASEPEAARALLDEPTRRSLDDLRDLLANGHIHLSASATRILFRKRGVIRELPELSLFTRLCDSVYERLLRAWERENGIEIIAETVLQDAETKCQVCSHPIAAESRVRCRRCRTPHHDDCWEFNGGCATFACGEKQPLKEVA